jgi:DNA-binding NtrC family response regulator
MLVESILEDAGFEVFVASDATSALALVAQRRFIAAIVDLALPDLGGDQLLKEFRTLAPRMGLVVSTGHALAAIAGDQQSAFKIPPGVAVLQKPWDDADLVSAVKAAIARRYPTLLTPTSLS